jgi:hypothetical protein
MNSKCCNAKLRVAGSVDNSGTNYWVCEECSKPCDLAAPEYPPSVASTKKAEPMNKPLWEKVPTDQEYPPKELLGSLSQQELDNLLYNSQINELAPRLKQYVLANVPWRFWEYYKSKHDWRSVTSKTNFQATCWRLKKNWREL